MRGIHKYDVHKELEKTKTAYADSWMEGEEGYKKRNLSWKGTAYMTPQDWFKNAKIVGEYNEFNPEKVFLILKSYPDAKIKLGREGSVAIYIDYGKHNPNKIMKDLKVLGSADELDFVERGWKISKYKAGKITEHEIPFPRGVNKLIRIWWD